MTSKPPKSFRGFLAYSKILFVISLLVLAFFSVNLVREFINRKDLQIEVNQLENEIKSLEQNNQELAGTIDYLKSLDFVENEARLKLNMRKPGEKIIIVPGDDEEVLSTEVKTINFEHKEDLLVSNPIKWWNYFFKIKK